MTVLADFPAVGHGPASRVVDDPAEGYALHVFARSGGGLLSSTILWSETPERAVWDATLELGLSGRDPVVLRFGEHAGEGWQVIDLPGLLLPIERADEERGEMIDRMLPAARGGEW